MKKLWLIVCLLIEQLCEASQQAAQMKNVDLQAALLQKVSGLKNSHEINAMMNQVGNYQQEYNQALQQGQQENMQNNYKIQLLKSEIASYTVESVINDFMKDPEPAYYHKTSRWPDNMHNLTFTMIRARAALKRNNSVEIQNDVKSVEASLLACLRAGGMEYIYPKERALKMQQVDDLQKLVELSEQKASKLSEQCTMLAVISSALVHKQQDRQVYLDAAWKQFVHDFAVKKTVQNKKEMIVQAGQFQKNKQLMFDAVMQETLANLTKEIACEQIESAWYDKKAFNLVDSCCKQAVKELAQEQRQAEQDALKAEKNARIAKDKELADLAQERAKAKKVQQQHNKKTQALADKKKLEDEDALLNAMIALNVQNQHNVSSSSSLNKVQDIALLRRDVMRDLIKVGYKGDALKVAMIDFDVNHMNLMQDNHLQDEQVIPRFLDLFQECLHISNLNFGHEVLLYEMTEKTMQLYVLLSQQGKKFEIPQDKKNKISQLIGLKLGQLEVACMALSMQNCYKESQKLHDEYTFMKETLQILENEFVEMQSQSQQNSPDAIKLQIKINQMKMKQKDIDQALLANESQRKILSTLDMLQRLQSLNGPFPLLNSSMSTTMGKLAQNDIQTFKIEFEKQCVNCIAVHGKIVSTELQPIMLVILYKSGLNKSDRQELALSMIENALVYNQNNQELPIDAKQSLLNHIMMQNNLAQKSYDVHVANDFADIQLVILEVLRKVIVR